jgi:glycosyltransferase involved in cell wall biosynthesis
MTETAARARSVAVLVPCHNEEAAIGEVVAGFRAALPDARILVVDNDSHDGTARIAREAGADVVTERRRGKGFALMRGLSELADVDYVIMVDGDATYPAEDAPKLLEAAEAGADMVIGTRLDRYDEGAYRPGHTFGNRLFIGLIRLLFGGRTNDLLSGYRVLSRRFLDEVPLLARGFEVETELSIQALMGGFPVVEIPVHYRQRGANSVSKLRTYRDGYRILVAMLAFFRDYRPLTFFGLLAAFFAVGALLAGGVVVDEYLRTRMVLRMPLAVLSVGLAMVSVMSAIGGLVLSSISRRAAELSVLLMRRRS